MGRLVARGWLAVCPRLVGWFPLVWLLWSAGWPGCALSRLVGWLPVVGLGARSWLAGCAQLVGWLPTVGWLVTHGWLVGGPWLVGCLRLLGGPVARGWLAGWVGACGCNGRPWLVLVGFPQLVGWLPAVRWPVACCWAYGGVRDTGYKHVPNFVCLGPTTPKYIHYAQEPNKSRQPRTIHFHVRVPWCLAVRMLACFSFATRKYTLSLPPEKAHHFSWSPLGLAVRRSEVGGRTQPGSRFVPCRACECGAEGEVRSGIEGPDPIHFPFRLAGFPFSLAPSPQLPIQLANWCFPTSYPTSSGLLCTYACLCGSQRPASQRVCIELKA